MSKICYTILTEVEEVELLLVKEGVTLLIPENRNQLSPQQVNSDVYSTIALSWKAFILFLTSNMTYRKGNHGHINDISWESDSYPKQGQNIFKPSMPCPEQH